MASTTIVVPDVHDYRRLGWMANVSAVIDAGNDVVFEDAEGNDVDIGALNVASNATIVCRSKDYTDADARTIYLIAGGWHRGMRVHKILGTAAGTTASAKIVARVE